MNKHDWLVVGLKLLGVYFAILGVAILSVTILNLVIDAILAARTSSSDLLVLHKGPSVSLLSALQPIAYLAGAFVLLRRTDWCLRKILSEESSSSPPAPPAAP